ncbi:M48 family metalloprotease [Azonexus sp.]|uniref:M48 family metalloprotease n=1 Tax=Azonexus sp. TaxID=1872668 RepID=UPI0035B00681
MFSPHRPLALLLAALLTVPPAAAQNLPELGEVASEELPVALEKRIGLQIMQEIRQREISYLDDYDIESYLNQLAGRLAGVSSDPGFGFEIFALTDPSINAFAMPGGYVGVHSGLILAAQSESELAGVLAHELSHVTQRHIARQIFQSKRIGIASMLAMGLGLLAARSNSQVAGAAIATSQAGAISAQLAYSRDFEREADRIAFDMLGRAGFDERGMAGFFGRLQQSVRLYENNAVAYLRTHPLTGERLADMQNREIGLNYRQVPDSLDFHLVRARLRAQQGRPSDAVKEFSEQLTARKFASEAAAHYGLALAYYRSRAWADAQREVDAARALGEVSPILEHLAADVRVAAGHGEEGLRIYRAAISRFPRNMALVYGYGAALTELRRFGEALKLADEQLRVRADDLRLHRLRAASYAGMGRPGAQHRALAEVFALQGQTAGAIEQLELARKAGGDFYEMSAIDSRLRELKLRRLEELKEKNN